MQIDFEGRTLENQREGGIFQLRQGERPPHSCLEIFLKPYFCSRVTYCWNKKFLILINLKKKSLVTNFCSFLEKSRESFTID